MRTLLLYMLVMIILLIAMDSCSTPAAVHHGATYYDGTYKHELDKMQIERNKLHVRLGAVGFIGLSGQPSLRFVAAIDSSGIKFSKAIAHLAIEVHLKGTIDTTTYSSLQLTRQEFGSTYHYHRRIQVPSGSYHVSLSLTDLTSGNKISKDATTTVPNGGAPGIKLGDIRVEGKQNGGTWQPVVGYNIPSRIDSLRFTLRINNDSTGSPLLIRARLVRFRADSSFAHPFSWQFAGQPPPLLVYRGIEYRYPKIISQNKRTLQISGAVQVRFPFKLPPHGNYRFKVKISKRSHKLFKARDFAVRSRNFPAVLSPREHAAPLIYLMQGRITKKGKSIIKTINSGSGTALSNIMDNLQFGENVLTGKSKYKKMMAIQDSNALEKAVKHFGGLTLETPPKPAK